MSFKLTLPEGRMLIQLGRHAIQHYLTTGRKLTPPTDAPPTLLEKRGVFVTLNTIEDEDKRLRGCIGYPLPTLPLIEATIDSAINAAAQDPRFPPVTHREMETIGVEISVLTPPSLITVKDPRDYVKEVEVGQDGLIVERGWLKGLLLPQVPVEWNWDAEEFLANCCMKASLPPDAWLMKGTKISKFSCIIVKEVTPKGEVVLEDMRD